MCKVISIANQKGGVAKTRSKVAEAYRNLTEEVLENEK